MSGGRNRGCGGGRRTALSARGQIQRGAGGAGPEPWRGRGAAGRGAGAVARNHAGRGSRRNRVRGRAEARLGRWREPLHASRGRGGRGRGGRGSGGGRAQRRGAPALALGGGRGRALHAYTVDLTRSGGVAFVCSKRSVEKRRCSQPCFSEENTRCALVCERLRCEPWRPWGFTAQACAAKSRRAASGAPHRHACGSAPTPSARLRSKRAARETLSLRQLDCALAPRTRVDYY